MEKKPAQQRAGTPLQERRDGTPGRTAARQRTPRMDDGSDGNTSSLDDYLATLYAGGQRPPDPTLREVLLALRDSFKKRARVRHDQARLALKAKLCGPSPDSA
eukprot:GEMP01088424.1.p2 GENE.GEMP01088424.1~~GEMP01088424.1.p2  ORF type:complete len:103 (+),score=24.06 GEMP01088424.1:237-545(+)